MGRVGRTPCAPVKRSISINGTKPKMIDWLIENSEWIVPLSAVFTIIATITAALHWFKKRIHEKQLFDGMSDSKKNTPKFQNGVNNIWEKPIRFVFKNEHPIMPNISAKIKSAVSNSINEVFNFIVNDNENPKDNNLPSIRVSVKVFFRGGRDPRIADNAYYIDNVYLSCDIYENHKIKLAGFTIEGIDKSNWLGFWPDAINDAAKQLRKALVKWRIRSNY